MTSPIRAFLAIPLPESPRARILELCRQLAHDLPQVRWNSGQNLHLTLKFFAAIEEESLEKIGEVMLSVGRFTAPFSLRIKGLGAFPNLTRPRVFWLGIDGDRALRQLHRELETGLSIYGFAPDQRPFAPHLTLGRPRGVLHDAGSILAQRQPGVDLEWPVDQLILYQSLLLPAGARHLPHRVVQLQGDSRPS